MPRIDPLQLLNCLRVLLSPSGGIKSKDEVQRLASLMTKFSKKLVSKCIYVQILKITEPELLGEFMGAGGWNLAHQWLSVAIMSQNLPFIKELLELLLICPVDVERLKANNCPKLIKNLTKEASNEEVRQLASRLVDQWLCIVKGLAMPPSAPGPVQESTVVLDLPAIQLPIMILSPEPVATVATVVDNIPDCINEPDEMITEAEFIDGQMLEEVKCEVLAPVVEEVPDVVDSVEDSSAVDVPNGTLPVYKITIRDGKQVLAKVTNSERAPRKQVLDSATLKHDIPKVSSSIIVTQQYDSIIKRRALEDQQKSPVSKPKKTEPSDVKRVAKDVNKKMLEKSLTERKIKLVEPSKEKPFEATNEKDRQRERKERELNKLKEKKAEKAASLAEKVAAQVEKDKATLAKLVPPPITKLGKIPKKPRVDDGKQTESKKEEKKTEHKRSPLSPDTKRSSTDSRKPLVNGRPKTVKVPPSKFRSTGLEEEIKPPSSKSRRSSSSSDRKSGSSRPEKRTSPTKEGQPPEKKAKVIPETAPPAPAPTPAEEPKKVDKPIIKPKRIQLTESDMFMDALTASTKKDVRKRKRKVSTSRDGTDTKKESKEDSPPGSPANSEDNMSPVVVKPPPRFYRETLEDDAEKEEKKEIKVEANETSPPETDETKENKSASPLREDAESITEKMEEATAEIDDGLPAGRYPRGVLVHHRKKGPKKAVRWRAEKELESIQFFELDETERVNVTKTFTDAKQNERTTEREAFQLARKLPQDDNMEEKTTWKFPTLIDLPKAVAEWGEKSQEKAIQYARESSVLSALYFSRSSIPDSASEPDMENHPAKDPVVIPLEDPSNNPESIMDHRAKGWPEPKPMLAPTSPVAATMFPATAPSFPPFAGAGPGFNGMPPGMFQPGNMGPGPGMMMQNGAQGSMGGDWRTGDGRVIPMDSSMSMDMYNQQGGPAMNMNMPGNMQGPGNMSLNNGPPMEMNYSMMPPTDEMGNQFPMQGYPMGPNMGGPPMFQPFQQRNMGPNNMRGNRNMGPRGQWFRPNGPNMGNGPNGQWQGGRGGPRPWVRGACHSFAARGSCRKGADCTYTH